MTTSYLKRIKTKYLQENITPVMKEAFPNVEKATKEILDDFILFIEMENKK